jgi:hypothetical protein
MNLEAKKLRFKRMLENDPVLENIVRECAYKIITKRKIPNMRSLVSSLSLRNRTYLFLDSITGS